MKINLDLKKVTGTVQDITKKTTDMGKKVSDNVQQKAKDLAEKTRNDNYARRMKKYNPLFMDKYQSEDFNIPNMIVIVDDAVRRGIDVCEGAIGWLGNENGMEVMYLYDEMVNDVGLKFVPVAMCDTIYYVDKFDRNRFIQVDCIFSKAHEERLAELEYIAYSLGAKSFSVEISESNSEIEISKKNATAKRGGKVESLSVTSEVSAQSDYSFSGKTQRSGKIEARFEGSNEVKVPVLKWFEYDDNIKHLIEMRCEGLNNIKSKTLILEGAVSATMSKKTAFAIDNAISEIGVKGSIGSKGKSEMERQATKENHSKLIFNVEF